MGKKFLLTIFSFLAVSSFASEDPMGNTYGAGSDADGGLSSDPTPLDGGGASSGRDQSVTGQLRGQGINFYIGAGLALNMFKGTMTATEGYPDGKPIPVGHKAKINSKYPGIAVTFGAQQKGQMLTDFGVMAMYSPTKITQKTSGQGGTVTDKNTIQQKYSFSVYGGVGVPFTPSINIFGKLGLVYSGFTTGYQQIGTATNSTQAKGAMGVAPGVMVQYKVSETFSTNLDISYAIYQAITTKNLATTPTGYEYKIKVAPRVLTIMLGGTMTLGSGK